jgi:putative ABC transport system permease protein
MLNDLRYGVRMLLKNRGFTAVAALTLALGIGANTAIFSVVNAVLLRPLPYREPDRLVVVRENMPRMKFFAGTITAGQFVDYKAGNEVFSDIAAFNSFGVNLTGVGEPQHIQAARVSANLFQLLGLVPVRGRSFLPEEDRTGSDQVVVLSYGLWQRQFGGDANVIGKTLQLDDKPFTIVGIMPQQFQFPHAGTPFAEPAELWVPLALPPEEVSDHAGSFNYCVIARLKPDVSMQQAQANMDAVAAGFPQQHPDIYKGDLMVTASVFPFAEEIVGKARPWLLILLGAVGVVLLMACANVANLMLARGAGRQREMAVRRALGAGTGQLIRQLLTESWLLSLLGGGAGLLSAVWLTGLIKALGPRAVPRLQAADLDLTVIAFALLASLLTGFVFGLFPAIQSSRFRLNEALKEAGGRSGQSRATQRMRSSLVVLETASAVVLLISAALLAQSFVRVLRASPGFDPAGVLVARTMLPESRYAQPKLAKGVHQQVIERLAALPGVEAAAAASNLPLADEWKIGFRIEGHDENEFNLANNTWVSSDYFRTLGIQLVKGRTFTDADREGAPAVILVNEAMAHRYWPGENPIGKRLKWGGWQPEWLMVVGVVADVKTSALDADAKAAIYMPLMQVPRGRLNAVYVLRSAGDASQLTFAVRDAIRSVDSNLPTYDILTLNQIVSASLSQRRFLLVLVLSFAASALGLSAIALYGAVSYSVSQRTREIGVRIALGAQHRDVLKLVLGQGMRMSLMGVALGLVGALAITRIMSSLLYQVRAADPATFVCSALLLTVIALVACWLPARRATRVDPMVALRYE